MARTSTRDLRLTLILLMAFVQRCVKGEDEVSCGHKSICDPLDYFFGIGAPASPLNITWAHAVNSQQLLEEGLGGDVMMLEADISLGFRDGSSVVVPIMAHPPANTSDLSFAEFIGRIVNATARGVRKGIKLDFKSIDAVEPALRIMQKYAKNITFPVMLNADVLGGPVNSTTRPVNGTRFLQLTQKYFPYAILSLGWTTKLDCYNLGRYERFHFQEMKQLIQDFDQYFPGNRLTFPVRAGLIAETLEDHVYEFQLAFPRSTFTLWSSAGDPLDMEKLHQFIKTLGSGSVYADLPFDLDTSENTSCSSGYDRSSSLMNRPSAAVLMLLMYAGFKRYV